MSEIGPFTSRIGVAPPADWWRMIDVKTRSGRFRFPYRITAFVRARMPRGAPWLLVAPLVLAPPCLGSSDAPSALVIHLLDLDTAPTVGKRLTLRARLVDPAGAVFSLRFRVNEYRGVKIPVSKGITDDSDTTTPNEGGRMAIVVEALDDRDTVLARDMVWVQASSPYKEKVEVHGAPVWGDLIPKESLLHQHPVVSVHSYASAAERGPDDRFGQNGRPVHIVFLVDGKGFGDRLPSILETLGAIAEPDGVILRARDEVGLLVIGDAPEARRDFRDGSLGRALAHLDGMGAARPEDIDLGFLLGAIVDASSPKVSTVGVIVINGVYWGTSSGTRRFPDTRANIF